MSIGAVSTARSLDVYARALPLCYTPPFPFSLLFWDGKAGSSDHFSLKNKPSTPIKKLNLWSVLLGGNCPAMWCLLHRTGQEQLIDQLKNKPVLKSLRSSKILQNSRQGCEFFICIFPIADLKFCFVSKKNCDRFDNWTDCNYINVDNWVGNPV